MSFLNGKTPVSYLSELCLQKGLKFDYYLEVGCTSSNRNEFIYELTVGEYKGTGNATSKKKAKHFAALSVLNQMMPDGADESTDQQPSLLINGNGNGYPAGNPVGELQELTQKKLLPPPLYEFDSEGSTGRLFTCTVGLLKLTASATGRSKKLAKRNAAQALLDQLKEDDLTKQISKIGIRSELEENDSKDGSLQSISLNYQALKEGRPIPRVSSASSQRQKIKLSLLQPKSIPAAAYCKMLQDVAEEQKFELTYVNLSEQTNTGLHQCLLQLSTLPVTVFHGRGATKDEAQACAIQHALSYLNILASKSSTF